MSPTPLERAPAPRLSGRPVPASRYTSAAFARREWEGMWRRVWLCAGRASDAPVPGAYFTFEIGPESILVIRQRDGSLAARANVCMHRGRRLRRPGRGRAQRFACPYHGWEYELDGSLAKATDPESFPGGLPCERLGLPEVRCDTWGGFVWVCLDSAAPPLREFLGVIPEHLDSYHFDDDGQWKLAFDLTLEVPCNWKTSVDAFNEAYHVHATHPATLEFTDDVGTTYDCYERHTRMIFPEVRPSPRHPGHGTLTPLLQAFFLKPLGIDPDAIEGGPDVARKAVAEALRRQGPELGIDFSELHDAQLVDDFHYTVFPNLTFNIHARFAWIFRHRPHPRDPERMLFDFWNLVRAPREEIPRPAHEEGRVEDGYSLAHVPGGDVLDEDMTNLPRVQEGMHAAGFRELVLGDQEIRIRHFHDVLMGYVESAPDTPGDDAP